MNPADDIMLKDAARVVLLQPAFLGDVVLSTALMESWHRCYPRHRLEVVVRKEAMGFFTGHPFLDHVHVWDRQGWGKYPRLSALSKQVRRRNPDVVINLHRHPSMALLADRSGAQYRFGFRESAKWYNRQIRSAPHNFGDGRHETQRNHELVEVCLGRWNAEDDVAKLHPTENDRLAASKWPSDGLVLAPSSVWTTKRWPAEQWSALADGWSRIAPDSPVILLGSASDRPLLEAVKKGCREARPCVIAGALDLLGSAALMRLSRLVVSNDSAPLHMAGAVGTPVVGVFCSTTPRYGFGPMPSMMDTRKAAVVEVPEAALRCKPCGPHGHAKCPLGHFSCGRDLNFERVLAAAVKVSSPLPESPSPW